jgi:hypothetical protein
MRVKDSYYILENTLDGDKDQKNQSVESKPV